MHDMEARIEEEEKTLKMSEERKKLQLNIQVTSLGSVNFPR